MPHKKIQTPDSKSEVGSQKSLINNIGLTPQRLALLLTPIAGAILALALGGILIQMSGVNPLKAYQVMVLGAFGAAAS